MASKFPTLFAGLAEPFAPGEVRQKPGGGGRTLSYVTARVCMNRLDAVVGPENWRDEYVETKEGLKCRLSIRLPDGEWLAKEDGGGFAGMAAKDDDEKSAYSDSFKRACVKFGIARYLYRDGTPDFRTREPGEDDAPAGTHPPVHPHPQPHAEPAGHGHANGNGHGGERRGDFKDRPPTNGRAFFAWIKRQEEERGEGLLKYINGYGKLQEFPGRMIDWDEECVKLAHAEATRKLNSPEA